MFQRTCLSGRYTKCGKQTDRQSSDREVIPVFHILTCIWLYNNLRKCTAISVYWKASLICNAVIFTFVCKSSVSSSSHEYLHGNLGVSYKSTNLSCHIILHNSTKNFMLQSWKRFTLFINIILFYTNLQLMLTNMLAHFHRVG